MYDILIWGLGERSKVIIESMNWDYCRLAGCIDKNKDKVIINQHSWNVMRKNNIKDIHFDFIIVTTLYIKEIKSDLERMQIPENKIIFFWYQDIAEYTFLNPYPKKYYLTKLELANCQRQIKNAKYEYGVYKGPIIRSSVELLEAIISDKKSLCRFGDGEFEIMLGRNRASFQEVTDEFSKKLKDVLHSTNPQVLIAVADNYGCLEQYTETAANDIRSYLTEDVRQEHMKLLEKDRIYYNAYVSRSYMMYKDKEFSKAIFQLYKDIFKDRNILLVEGEHTRTGYNNDLFYTAKSIKRILCPDKNCYHLYDQIYTAILDNSEKSDLILITLGSVATILAYDLACHGYQAIDLGQLDNEYEWSLRGSQKKEAIMGKTVSDIREDMHMEDIPVDTKYESEIILRVHS